MGRHGSGTTSQPSITPLLLLLLAAAGAACFIWEPLQVIAFVGFLLVVMALSVACVLVHKSLLWAIPTLAMLLYFVPAALGQDDLFWDAIVPWTAAVGVGVLALLVLWVLTTTRGRTAWLDWRGLRAMQRGRYDTAERHFRRTLALREARYGSEHRGIGWSLMLLAHLAHERGELEQVRDMAGQALALQQRLLPDNHADLRGSLNLLSAAVIGLGRFREGAELCRQQLEFLPDKPGQQRLERAVVLHNLALCLMELGEYAQAEELCQAVQDLLRQEPYLKLWGCNAYVHSLGAEISLRQQRLREAYRRATEAVGKIEPQVAPYQTYRTVPLLRQARAVLALDAAQEALDITEGVLAAQEQFFGPDHHFLAGSWHLRGKACARLGRHPEAAEAFHRALQLYEKRLPTHPRLAEILDDWGWMLFQQGRVAEAASHLRRALECRRSWLPDYHPDLALSLAHAAALHRTLGQEAEGQRLAAESAAVRQRHEEREAAEPGQSRPKVEC